MASIQVSLLILFTLMASACGGSLSDEQRKKIIQEMEQGQIVKLSDADIVSASLTKGRTIYAALKASGFSASAIDSLERTSNIRIAFLTPSATSALAVEQELIEAYVNGLGSGGLQENIQKRWTSPTRTDYDSLIYSVPIVTTTANGVETLEGIWNIYLSKKQVVLGFHKKKGK